LGFSASFPRHEFLYCISLLFREFSAKFFSLISNDSTLSFGISRSSLFFGSLRSADSRVEPAARDHPRWSAASRCRVGGGGAGGAHVFLSLISLPRDSSPSLPISHVAHRRLVTWVSHGGA
jgi:hypothetical protein